MRASADPAADSFRALRLAPGLYPSHPSSWTRSNEPERTDERNSCAGAAGATNPGRLASLCRLARSRPAGLATVRTYCVSLAIREIANSRARGDLAGADD